MNSSLDVLVIGAGPIGTAFACELLQQGLTVRLVDRADEAPPDDPHSRAVLLVPRALEQLHRIGVSERLAAIGRHVPAISYHSGRRLLGRARLDQLTGTPYNYLLALPQRDTEKVLQGRLHELGGRAERGLELMAIEDVHKHPRCVLRHRDGSAEEVRASYVVGADGAASTTRRLLDVQLCGDPTDVTYLIADAPVAAPLTPDAHYYYAADGLLAVVPLADGNFRIAGNIAHDLGGAAGRPEDLKTLLSQIVDRRAGPGFGVGTPTYARTVRPRCGIADRFSVGRVFLVGDAAHVITPAGGQGMNLGFGDVSNLGWKLGGVLNGRLREEVLASYHQERHDAAARIAATTARIVAFARQSTWLGARLRDTGFAAAQRAGLVQRCLSPLLSQLDVDYGTSFDGTILRRTRPVHAGQRVPLLARAPEAAGLSADAAATLRPSRPQLDPDAHTVILWPGRRVAPTWPEEVARFRASLPADTRVLDLATAGAEGDAVMRASLGDRRLVATVRPDGHLQQLWTTWDPEGTARALAAHAPALSPHRQTPLLIRRD